jgi:hypothetical protein
VDWVYLAFIPGLEPAFAAFRENFHMAEYDYYGTPVGDLQLMQETLTIEDVEGILFLDTGYNSAAFMRQFQPWKPCAYGCTQAAWFTQLVTYYAAGQLEGIVNAAKGAYEYEVLSGIPGLGSNIMNGLTFAQIYMVCLIVACNVRIWWPRISGRGEK